MINDSSRSYYYISMLHCIKKLCRTIVTLEEISRHLETYRDIQRDNAAKELEIISVSTIDSYIEALEMSNLIYLAKTDGCWQQGCSERKTQNFYCRCGDS